MATGPHNRKKSNFPAATTISGSDTLDYVTQGVNYKITFDNFIASLGVTGTIVQDGAVTGTPVLDTQGTVNNIRNLENGSGVKASVSPENGITLDHGFVSGGGLPILSDITATAPIIRGVAAGQGMGISESGGVLTFSVTGLPAITDIVIVVTVSDFPDPVAGVITLESGKTYSLQGLIDISPNRIVIPGSTVIYSQNRLTRGLTTDNPGALLTANDGGAFILREILLISTGGGSYLNLSGGGAVGIENVLGVRSGAVSVIGDMDNVTFRNFSQVETGSGTYGFLWTGTHGEFNCSLGFYTGWTGTLFDFGTAVFTRGMTMGGDIRMLTDAGNTAISGAAASANIAVGAFGLCYSNKITGTGTALSGITASDDRWEFHKTDGVTETRSDALISLTGNATETAIAISSTPVKVAGTWAIQGESQFTSDASGRMTYTGASNQSLPFEFTYSMLLASGGSADLEGVLALNGTVIPETSTKVTASSSAYGTGGSIWQHHFTAGDYVELWVQNDSNTTNIIVDGVGRVN